MHFERLLQQRLESLHREGRYRVFADLKRRRGSFPVADHFAADGPRAGSEPDRAPKAKPDPAERSDCPRQTLSQMRDAALASQKAKP